MSAAVYEFLAGDLGQSPKRVGKPLAGNFTGWWSARRGPYRVLYEVDEEVRVVRVLRIEHRADAYRRR